jgi:hypothetical protein
MQVELHQGQIEVANAPHRYRIVTAGRRWGKSTLAQLIVIQWAVKQEGNYWIVAPSYRQAKMIHWRAIQKLLPKEWIKKKNEVELSLTLQNGSTIELKGAENPDALRGIKLRGLVIDEIASIRNWDWLWSEVLRPTLTDYEAPALFISTPKGYNHFYDLYLRGQEKVGEYKSWRFTSYDNPYIKASEIDAARNELTEDTFAQEYMADFRKATGLAHKDWDRDIHLIEPFAIPKDWSRARGFDFGGSHPTASVKVAIAKKMGNDQKPTWFVESCYKSGTQIIQEHATAIKSQDYEHGHVQTWGDPSGKQWMLEFRQHGLNIQPANKEVGQGMRGWVEHCIEKVNELLKPQPGRTITLPGGTKIENAPRLLVLNTPENQEWVKEVEALRWRETQAGVTIPVLDEDADPNGHCDLLAATRYLVVSWKEAKWKQDWKNQIPAQEIFDEYGNPNV